MIKHKWVSPFLATILLAFPPPADLTLRVVHVVGVLMYVGIMLAIIQPWKADDGTDDRAGLRVGKLR